MQKTHWQERLLTALSQLHFSRYPCFLLWRPTCFALGGQQTRDIIQTVKPGDVLIRSFNQQVGYRLLPGTFSDMGFFVGKVTEQHLRQVAKIDYVHPYPQGEQMVIGSQNGQACLLDLIDFCRCDGLAILRFPDTLTLQSGMKPPHELMAYLDSPEQCLLTQPPAVQNKKGEEPIEPPTNTELDAAYLGLIKAEKELILFLRQGKTVPFSKVLPMLFRLALRQLNPPGQFQIGLTAPVIMHSNQVMYEIIKSVCWNYGIIPTETRILMQTYSLLPPDTFIESLEEVWKWVG